MLRRQGSADSAYQVWETYFADAETRDLALLRLSGKWEFAFLYLIGDDFDVTR